MTLHPHPAAAPDHGGHDHDHAGPCGDAAAVAVAPTGRPAAVRRARLLNRITLAYNATEAVVALTAGVVAGSISLLGFGLDSVVEVSAALILTWRLAMERRGGCTQATDRRATKAIALSFGALAAYIGVESVRRLVAGEQPDATLVGIALTGVSVVIMPVLARAKRQVAPALGSRAQVAEANQTALCALMSGVVLVGLVANAALGWWWADPLAGAGIAVLAAVEAVRTWRAESLADTCCA